jgi:hypothetical protein
MEQEKQEKIIAEEQPRKLPAAAAPESIIRSMRRKFARITSSSVPSALARLLLLLT